MAAIGSFALADTGANDVPITADSSLPDGKATSFTALGGSITRPNGNATIQAGVLVGRVLLANGYGNRIKLDFSWLDPQDASEVLTNPNAQIYVGLYHPVSRPSTGAGCGALSPSVAQPFANITDNGIAGVTGTDQWCAKVDTAATGSMTTSGKLIISRTSLAGYLKSSLDDSAAPTCPTGGTTGPWCHPSGLDASQNVLWVTMTIVTPGGKPAGQQNNLSSLSFFSSLSAL